MPRSLLCRLSVIALAVFSLAALHTRAFAQSKPAVGSPNVAVADPPVPRPGTKPCVVTLFPTENFGPTGENTRMDAVPHSFSYHPPAGCKGAWAKVVLEARFSVDPGRQYDRTASIWLNGVSLYFGTTEEPSPNFGPSWQVERDLTDYTSLLRSPGRGAALINNWVDPLRRSIIHASARLLFYPADARYPAPKTPDAVYSLNGVINAPANLQTGDDRLLRRMAFPPNTTRVYLDLFAQSQFHDEFWYTCLPDQYIQQTTAFALKRGYKGAPVHARACSGGSYREAEVSVDGKPAGLAPISPWVYTGGIDPYLWRPTPGVETLDFAPYRLDLTPFAGLLSDGAQHTVSVRVLGANHYFSVAAALLVYRDPKARQTRGAITRNTLAGASLAPTVASTLGQNPAEVNGKVLTKAQQSYVIEGYVDTSAGRVRNRVNETIRFANTQSFSTLEPGTTRHVTEQTAHAETTSSSTGGSTAERTFHRVFDYSLTADVLRRSNQNRGGARRVHLDQRFAKQMEQREAGRPPYQASIRNRRTAADQITFNATHRGLSGNHGQTSTQIFAFSDSLGDCYRAEVQALDGKVSRITQGAGCGAKPVRWFVHPNGWPESFGWRENRAR
ncbi:MAG: peptide-N4-asparagine amidase [Terriglobia bacterium]